MTYEQNKVCRGKRQINFNKFIAGTDKQQYQYKSFSPEKINKAWTWDDPILNVLMEKATRKLGELNAFTLIVPNIDLFIQMHIIKEANTSSKIEGTQTNIDEALLPEEDIALEKRDDWQEVQNYINAMNYAINKLEKLPISSGGWEKENFIVEYTGNKRNKKYIFQRYLKLFY
jgi:Fic family protein